jgi:hypothetical protein
MTVFGYDWHRLAFTKREINFETIVFEEEIKFILSI